MHLSLALLVLLFSLILSNVINRVFPRLPLPLIQIIFGVGISLLFKGKAFELETELFLAFIIAPLLFREGGESDITSILLEAHSVFDFSSHLRLYARNRLSC